MADADEKTAHASIHHESHPKQATTSKRKRKRGTQKQRAHRKNNYTQQPSAQDVRDRSVNEFKKSQEKAQLRSKHSKSSHCRPKIPFTEPVCVILKQMRFHKPLLDFQREKKTLETLLPIANAQNKIDDSVCTWLNLVLILVFRLYEICFISGHAPPNSIYNYYTSEVIVPTQYLGREVHTNRPVFLATYGLVHTRQLKHNPYDVCYFDIGTGDGPYDAISINSLISLIKTLQEVNGMKRKMIKTISEYIIGDKGYNSNVNNGVSWHGEDSHPLLLIIMTCYGGVLANAIRQVNNNRNLWIITVKSEIEVLDIVVNDFVAMLFIMFRVLYLAGEKWTSHVETVFRSACEFVANKYDGDKRFCNCYRCGDKDCLMQERHIVPNGGVPVRKCCRVHWCQVGTIHNPSFADVFELDECNCSK